MKKEGLPELYKDLEELLDSGLSPDMIINGCVQVSDAHPNESRCWLIASKAYQALNDAEAALKTILTAIELDPMNMDNTFQLFNVFIQMEKYSKLLLRYIF